ncbi:restriction modification system DNA specificity domain protein [Methanohalobium evestigatum Z-7303]|uniref:Restriction modification system DNA specificity domain protein n=1 Tax=Methanohalobium evestigatum (strain ATCC BAA-1072 / DSM 3721 / NBRC 107634 / OCM 161 / Z-7303) TaxID=644295 RepID=D7E681_METEZ|nr:restriction endonuclease subunit S [Methanohalobium evestigatum]ADI73103.1 restriction modification system DNA specificity domain protein [Methanohalobium evestigatum Z-7303]
MRCSDITETIKLKNLLESNKLIRGIAKTREDNSNDTEKINVFMVNIKNLEDGIVDLKSTEECNVKKSDFEKPKPKKGDVIIPIRGSDFKSAVAPSGIENKGYVISLNLVALRVNNKILPRVLSEYFNSPQGQISLERISKGTKIKSIPIKELKELDIPVPNLDDQNKFDKYLEAIQDYKLRLREEKEFTEKMKKSVAFKYFRGY